MSDSQSVVARLRAFQGVFAFLTFSYGNGGTKSSKKCWNGVTNCEGGARIHGDLPQRGETNQSTRFSNNRLSAPVSVHSLLRRLFKLESSILSRKKCIYEICSRKAISTAVDYAMLRSRSHDAVIPIYDEAGNVIETHEHGGDFREP